MLLYVQCRIWDKLHMVIVHELTAAEQHSVYRDVGCGWLHFQAFSNLLSITYGGFIDKLEYEPLRGDVICCVVSVRYGLHLPETKAHMGNVPDGRVPQWTEPDS